MTNTNPPSYPNCGNTPQLVDTRTLYNTTGHEHIGRELIEVILVSCADGRYFIENNWHDSDLDGAQGISNPHIDPYVEPEFFADRDAGLARAEKIMQTIIPDFSISEI